MKKLSLSKIELETLEIDKNILYEIEINYNNAKYCLKLFLKDLNDKIIVFSNGAIDPKKNIPPVYMRSSWIDDINASCIFLDDPTTHKNKLRLGWGQGTDTNFALEDWATIIQMLLNKLKIKEENTYFYGSSAGGFMSIYFSILIPNTIAIANNPQTKVLNYLAPYVNNMLKNSYSINNIKDVPEEILYRLDLVEAIKYYNNTPKKVYYLQNYLCPGDIEKHYNPFLESLNKNNIELNGLCVVNYFKESLGHNPLPKSITLRYIHSIIDGKLDLKL